MHRRIAESNLYLNLSADRQRPFDPSGSERQFDAKGRAFARTALDDNRPSMLRDDPPRDGKSESGAPEIAAASLIDAVEAIKDFVLLCLGDPDAAIAHSNHGVVSLLFERQVHRSWGRSVFERVVQKDIGDTPQGGLIAQDG